MCTNIRHLFLSAVVLYIFSFEKLTDKSMGSNLRKWSLRNFRDCSLFLYLAIRYGAGSHNELLYQYGHPFFRKNVFWRWIQGDMDNRFPDVRVECDIRFESKACTQIQTAHYRKCMPLFSGVTIPLPYRRPPLSYCMRSFRRTNCSMWYSAPWRYSFLVRYSFSYRFVSSITCLHTSSSLRVSLASL